MNEWDQRTLDNLITILASLYPTESDSRRISAKAGINTAAVTFEKQALNNWFSILNYANPRGKVEALVKSALDENPDNEALKSSLAGRAEITPPSAERTKRDRGMLGPITDPSPAKWTVDDFPIEWARKEAQDLERLLVAAIMEPRTALYYATNAGVPLGAVNSNQPPKVLWREILEAAARAGMLRRLLEQIAADPGFGGIAPKLRAYL